MATELAIALASDVEAVGPAATRRDVSALARGMVALVRADPRDRRLLLWQELANSLPEELGEHAHQAVTAARACLSDLRSVDPERDAGAPSYREYESWHQDPAHAERAKSWPSVSSVQRWASPDPRRPSWAHVQEALGQKPSPRAVAARKAAQGGAATGRVLARQLRVCRVALGEPGKPRNYITIGEHREWVDTELARSSDERALSHYFVDPQTFRNAFGTWAAAIEASGGERPTGGSRHQRSRRESYTSSSCVAAAKLVGIRTSLRELLTDRLYDAHAPALRRVLLAEGDERVLPGSKVIVDRVGSWPVVLRKAGFIDAAECRRRLARSAGTERRFRSDDELYDVLAEAFVELGRNPYTTDYDACRREQRRTSGQAHWPTRETVRRRVANDWFEAVDRVCGQRPQVVGAWLAAEMTAVSAT